MDFFDWKMTIIGSVTLQGVMSYIARVPRVEVLICFTNSSFFIDSANLQFDFFLYLNLKHNYEHFLTSKSILSESTTEEVL